MRLHLLSIINIACKHIVYYNYAFSFINDILYVFLPEDILQLFVQLLRNVRIDPELVRLAPNGTNPGLFSDQISVHFGSASQNVLKSDLKNPGFVPFGKKTDLLWAKI